MYSFAANRNAMEDVYVCKTCGWEGGAELLEWDRVETCMGVDEVATCPACGSMDMRLGQ